MAAHHLKWDPKSGEAADMARALIDAAKRARAFLQKHGENMVVGADLIVEHYPVGWKGVVRRIDRVNPEWAASMTFKKIEEVPHGA